MSLYFTLLLGSISVPLLLSFDKKVAFYLSWKWVLPAIILVAAEFIAWDIWLTHLGVWGFNERYHGSWTPGGLPIEEWLFFIVVPYASLFLHYVLRAYFPNLALGDRTFKFLNYGLLALLAFLLVVFHDRTYTAYIFAHTIFALLLGLFDKRKTMQTYFLSFLLILVPFFLVNGILTGSFIEGEVVWYNDAENMGIRIFTIPIEDSAYAFSMIYYSLFLIEWWKSKSRLS